MSDLFQDLSRDLRFAARGLIRRPMLTGTAIFSLALGIGANATIFAAIDAVLLYRPQVHAVERLVSIFVTDPERSALEPISHINATDLKHTSRNFSDFSVYRSISVSLGGEAPEMIFAELVSASHLDLLGVRPVYGRSFSPEEGKPGVGAAVVVLGHGLWQRRFAADPKVIGQTVQINRHPFTVIGVAPAGFRGLHLLESPELWLPIGAWREVLFGPAATGFERRGARMFRLVARLAPGIGRAAADQELAALARQLRELDPAVNKDLELTALPLLEATIDPERRHVFARAGWILSTVVALLLVVACTNLANLQLAFSVARRREIAVRLAVGARRSQLVRQLLIEAGLLGLLGAAAGLLVALGGSRILWALRPPFLGDAVTLTLGWRVVGFSLLLGLATSLLFGLAPALGATRPNLVSDLETGRASRGLGTGARRFLSALVGAQVAVCTVVLIATALFLGSLRNARATELGFDPVGLFLVPVNLGPQGYDEAAALDFFTRATERVAALPGVAAVAISERPVLAPGGNRRQLTAKDGAADDPNLARLELPFSRISSNYFATMGARLFAGRAFTDGDRQGAPKVAVINTALAERLWPAGDAVGHRLRFDGSPSWVEVVGVVQDVQVHGLEPAPPPYVYLPMLQEPLVASILYVRVSGDPKQVIPSVRAALGELEPGLALLEAREVSALLWRALWSARMLAGLLGLFGLLTVVFVTLGIYGVVAYTTALRSREVGLRLALGAERGQVFRLLLRQGSTPVLAGLFTGLVVAALIAPRMASLLYRLDPRDPGSFLLATLVLLAIGTAAVALPSHRASRASPAVVLDSD